MPHRAPADVVAFHRNVVALCEARLRDTYTAASGLFDRQLRDGQPGATIGTEDLTSTGICLIGIHRAGIPATSIGFEPRRSVMAMCAALKRHGYPGGLGLVIWANAVWDVLPVDQLLAECGLSLSDTRSLVAPLTTMETAWLLSGLVHEEVRSGAAVQAARNDVLAELLGRFQADSRIFHHASERAPLRHRMRRHIANFADQIYSVQALAFAAISGNHAAARQASDAAARRLIELQGPLGQWWWHYNPRTGGVAQSFPVYSVHQHAMGPMALMASAAASGTAHHEAVSLSHRWIQHNELGVDLLDLKAGTIWRDIEPKESEFQRLETHARSLLGLNESNLDRRRSLLTVNRETRPYEWAWCLYAGAIAEGQPRESHVV
jgi:hypothetical protein